MLYVSCSEDLVHRTHKLSLQLVFLLGLLQQHVGLREFGLQQLLLEVPVFEDLLQVLRRRSSGEISGGVCACRLRVTLKESHYQTLCVCSMCVCACVRINTASRWSYCEMSPLSFSARALFSWQSLVLRLLCSSIWAWISLSVPWKWVVISFLFRSSSLHLCRVSSCG